MNNSAKRVISVLLVAMLCLSLLSGLSFAAQVDYQTGNPEGFENVILNWGHRGTDATFLSPNAVSFYSENNVTYSQLADLQGSADVGSVPNSALYKRLQGLMVSNHSYITSYGDTRPLYSYTDCQDGTRNKLTCFYSGISIGPDWDSGATWNREHTWPNSKGMEGSDEDDIMMLRPASSSVNSSRGNDAYGESEGFFNPNKPSNWVYDIRGDVARIFLYIYVRWGNTAAPWGKDGVIESKDVLLKWMEADPVDTWEMGRNDSVESITGTRNVFIDYPELAFALFNEELPTTMTTPSGEAIASGSTHTITALSNNGAWGSVSLSGKTINASPATGYQVSGYTLLSGQATVVRNGNAFTVEADSDCIIQINFAALESYTVTFHENGAVADTKAAFAGNSIVLPQPATEVPDGYHFLGWVTEAVSATTQKPASVSAADTKVTIYADADYYALYSYLGEAGTGGNAYQLYSGDLTEGNYLITYSDGAMQAAVVNTRLSYAEVSPVNGVISAPSADLIWKIAFDGSYVTLFNESEGKYAASTGAANKAKLETAVTDNSRWTAVGTELYEFENLANKTKGVNYTLRRNNNNGFATYHTSTGGSLTLYKQSNYNLYYATDAIICEHANTVNAEAVAPNCTQSGYTAGISCSDCGAWISGHETVPALGHSYDVVQTPPTCTEKGKAQYTCSVCGSSYSTALPATGHSFEEGICVDCGAEDPNFGAPVGGYQLVTSLEDITAGGQFVIVVNNAGSYQAMDTTVTSGKILGVDVAVEDDTVTTENPPVWTIEAVDGGVALQINGSYIKWGSSTSFTSLKTPYTWAVEQSETGGIRLIAAATMSESSVRGILYRLSADKFAPYACSNAGNEDYIADLMLFKYQVEGSEDCQHSYSEAVTTVPGCETEGTKTFTCSSCGIRYTEVIPATGHTEEPVSGFAPTCTDSGLTDGVSCSVCGKVITAQKYIPANGHSFTDGICTVCGEEDSGSQAPTTGYVLVSSLDDVLSGGQFVIAANNGGSWQALGTTISGKIEGLDVTVDNNTVTCDAPPVWTIEAVDGGVALSVDGSYINWNTSTNFAAQETPYTWVLEQSETGGIRLIASTTLTEKSVRGIIYRASYDRFAPYACSNEKDADYILDLHLFKYQEATGGECQHSYEAVVTEPTATSQGYTTYTCTACGDSYVGDYVDALGLTVSGRITSFGEASEAVTVELWSNGAAVATLTAIDGSYSFENVAAGEYTLKFSKLNHVTHEYAVTVAAEAVVQDATICLIGDVTGDGEIDIADTGKIYAHVKGTAELTGYAFACGDVMADGEINIADTGTVYAHVKGTKMIF